MKTCIVIPNYNHGKSIAAVLKRPLVNQLPCIIVDDGSDQETKAQLKKLDELHSNLTLVTLPHNLGKGGAVIAGLKYAFEQGFTHALQVDADGQHDLSDIPTFLATSKSHPEALIAGAPAYDASAPKSRLYGRRITNFWVSIETLSRDIKDAMCGFRIYPLAATLPIINKRSIGLRMDFDIEILVRLYWRNCEIIPVPTKVIYPEDGVSHFNLLQDNMRISWMHTKLFFGMLPRIPLLLWHKLKRSSNSNNKKQWFQIKERGATFGLKFMLYAYKLIGRRFASYLLYPVVAYFYWFSGGSRKASKTYLNHLAASTGKSNDLSSFSHFLSFAQSALDKLSVWNNDIKLSQIDFINAESLRQRVKDKKGMVIITAHLGNIEIARSLSRFEPDVKVNALVFSSNARKFNQILEKVNPDCHLNMIEVNNTDISLAMELKQKIDDGEMIVIVADRTSITNPGRCTQATFLNQTANFPQGPFILAGLMHCPVYYMLCVKQKETDSFKIIFEEFSGGINIQRKNRQENLAKYTQQYADILTKYCKLYPLQWYNFFNFWSDKP